ncbi:hypothetical protein KSS87_014518 [Heliosperma pusillum]|nr:hypothetical protein KSS87_014518 [Heliosperma pusillum]
MFIVVLIVSGMVYVLDSSHFCFYISHPGLLVNCVLCCCNVL